MDMIKIIAFALMALFLLGILRQYNPNYALLMSLAACALLLALAVRALTPVFSFAQTLAAYARWSDFSVVYKAVAISLLSQSAQDLCRESGQLALAGRVEFAGKVAVLVAAMPLFTSLGGIILELLR